MSAPIRKKSPGPNTRDVVPEAQVYSSASADEPAQGRVDTQTRYRDRPTDDGKHGDADAEPRPDELRRKSGAH